MNIPAEREAAANSWLCPDAKAPMAMAQEGFRPCLYLHRCQEAQPQGTNPYRAIFCSALTELLSGAVGLDRMTVLSLQLQFSGTLVLHVRQVPT